MLLEEEVGAEVTRLLAMVCTDETPRDAYEFVLKKLTRMAILGTLPPGSRPRTPAEVTQNSEDESYNKERWIAP